MTINMQTVISNMRVLKSKGVTYSMGGSRTGSDGTADCSGAVYASLNAAGANLAIGNTDSLFRDLPSLGFSKTNNPYAYGDIFVFGIEGQSGGAAGHTGIFLDKDNIIHCNDGSNGVSIDNFNAVLNYDGNPPHAVFRLQNEAGEQPTPTEDATKEENTKENMDNAGEIEEYSYIGATLCIKGWHFASDSKSDSEGGDDGDGENGGGDGGGDNPSGPFKDGDIVNAGYVFSNTNLNLLLKYAAQRNIKPSFMIAQLFIESHWGDPNTSLTGVQDNNWAGISMPFNPPPGVTVSQGTPRPSNEGGYYVKFATLDDFFNSYCFVLSKANGLYNVEGKTTLEDYVRGLFRVGGANADYAAAGFERYLNLMQPTYNALLSQNPGKLEKLDALASGTKSAKVENKIARVSNERTAKAVTASKEILEIYDATNDKKLRSIDVPPMKRLDIAEQNPDVEGIEWSGIEGCTEFEHSNPFYIQLVRALSDGTRKVLHVPVIFFPHSSSRTNIGHDYCSDDYFIIICTDKTGKTEFVKKVIGGISWTIEANGIPACSFTVPIYDADKFDGHMDCKVIIYKKMFDGIVKSINLNKDDETVTIELDHKISEWEYRQIPNNYTVKNQTFPMVFCQSPFLHSTEWYVDADAQAHKEKINYAFSRQSHLEALNKAVELTHDLWWRVGTRYDRYLEIGSFGEKKNYILSESGQTERHLKMIDQVSISKEFEQVFNVVTVYGEKSDSSQASLTLREAYLDQQQQGHDIIEGFPIVILNSTANKEQKNYYTNITKIASSNSLEFAILDEFSINLEQGKLIEKTVSMNDVAPFEDNGKTISDEERAKQSMIAYKAAVAQLKSARRRDVIKVRIGELPCDLNVLDRIYFDYHNSIVLFDKCSRYCKKIYEASDDFYIIKIDTSFDSNFVETNVLTLSKELYRDAGNY